LSRQGDEPHENASGGEKEDLPEPLGHVSAPEEKADGDLSVILKGVTCGSEHGKSDSQGVAFHLPSRSLAFISDFPPIRQWQGEENPKWPGGPDQAPRHEILLPF
jgi:hypothetical protein